MKKNIYILEDQEIFLIAYESIFSHNKELNLSGISNKFSYDIARVKLAEIKPDLLLVGTRSLTPHTLEEINKIHADFPGLGIILTCSSCQSESTQALKNLPKEAKTGMAIFLKQSLDKLNQLMKIIQSVSKGEYILDPALSDAVISKVDDDLFLKELTRREMEILNLIAEGYSNSAMAAILFIDIKTVRHHINNIYSKLKMDEDFNLKHPRVRATRRYLAMKGM
jgi:DNA-binding NarL/FixJ family response regulator